MTDPDKKIHVEIPELKLRQFKDKGPTFIATIPPTVEGLYIYVDYMLIVYINKPQNKHVNKYFADLAKLAKSEGFEMVRKEDFPNKQFIYYFESNGE